jgi:large subunit ribosomal protein L32
MALPKKKTSKSRRNMRRAHDHVATPNVILCKCGEPTLSHCACNACGTYKGRQVLNTENA